MQRIRFWAYQDDHVILKTNNMVRKIKTGLRSNLYVCCARFSVSPLALAVLLLFLTEDSNMSSESRLLCREISRRIFVKLYAMIISGITKNRRTVNKVYASSKRSNFDSCSPGGCFKWLYSSANEIHDRETTEFQIETNQIKPRVLMTRDLVTKLWYLNGDRIQIWRSNITASICNIVETAMKRYNTIDAKRKDCSWVCLLAIIWSGMTTKPFNISDHARLTKIVFVFVRRLSRVAKSEITIKLMRNINAANKLNNNMYSLV